MKILVAVKHVIDANVKIHVKSDGTGVETRTVKKSINPFDEIAVEEAVRVKEKNLAEEIIAVSIGSTPCQETLRHALALGADRAILVDTDDALEPIHVAEILKVLVNQENVSLVFLGKQAIDDDCNQTGQMLAAMLDWPQATFASRLDLENDQAVVTREVDSGLETLKVTLPAVITTDLRLNQPRYLSLPNIMRARSKPITTLSLTSLNLDLPKHQNVLRIDPPTQRSPGKKLNNIREIMKIIAQENEAPV